MINDELIRYQNIAPTDISNGRALCFVLAGPGLVPITRERKPKG